MQKNEEMEDWIEREALHLAAADGDLSKVKELIQQKAMTSIRLMTFHGHLCIMP